MKKLFFQLSALVLVATLVTSCAKPPQVELDSAKASLEAAKLVEANRYLADEFNALQDSLNAASVAIETEKSKSFISRSYGTIAEKLVKITADGNCASAKLLHVL